MMLFRLIPRPVLPSDIYSFNSPHHQLKMLSYRFAKGVELLAVYLKGEGYSTRAVGTEGNEDNVKDEGE
jgi:hypothetical protein